MGNSQDFEVFIGGTRSFGRSHDGRPRSCRIGGVEKASDRPGKSNRRRPGSMIQNAADFLLRSDDEENANAKR